MTRSEIANALISLLGDRPVAYHPMLAKILGGVKCALFVSQLLFWHEKGARADGFIWKTQKEFEEETGLSRYEQETARKKLRNLGVLFEKKHGIPAKLHYKLDTDRLAELIVTYTNSRMQETSNQECGNTTNSSVENQQCITESTTESTTEIVQPPIQANKPKQSTMECEIVDGFFGCWSCGERVRLKEIKEHSTCPSCGKTVYVYQLSGFGNSKKWLSKPNQTPKHKQSFDKEPVDAFMELCNIPNLPPKKRKQFGYQIQQVADERQATPEQSTKAIEALKASEYGWMSFTSPYQDTFKNAFDVLLARVIAGKLTTKDAIWERGIVD